MDNCAVKKFLQWFVTIRNPKEIFNHHTSFLAVEILFYFCIVLSLKHATRLGGRHLYLWLTAVFHGLAIESLSYLIPDVDNFWHAQSTVMLLGQRLPLHIICFYPVVIYTASVAVSRLSLPSWSEPCAVGLAVILLDIPWDILGVKLLWWSWHDTDPNVQDRFYWVPWTSLYFFAAFTSSLTFILHGFRKILTRQGKYQSSGCLKEITCSILAGSLSVPLGVVQFILLYHIPHDIFGIPTNLCVILYLTIFLLMSWSGDRQANSNARTKGSISKKMDELVILVLVYFLFMITTVFLAQPNSIHSDGLHQPIGNCNEIIPVHTPIGIVLSKKKYLCTTNFDEGYYDFNCTSEDVSKWKDSEWYTICGTPFTNVYEYIALIIGTSFVSIYVYYQMLLKSGNDVLATTTRRGQKLKSK